MESGKTDVVHSCPLHRSHKSHGRTGPTSPTGPASLVRVPHIPQAPQAPQVVAQAPTSLHVPPRAQLAPQVPMAHGPTCHTSPTSLTSRTAFPKDSNGPGRGERLAGWSLRSGRAPAASASGWIPLKGLRLTPHPAWSYNIQHHTTYNIQHATYNILNITTNNIHRQKTGWKMEGGGW